MQVIWVPGSFEIPVVAQQLALSEKYHAVLCIGAVVSILWQPLYSGNSISALSALAWCFSWFVSVQVRGATTHYDAVANSAASGIMSASLKSSKSHPNASYLPYFSMCMKWSLRMWCELQSVRAGNLLLGELV
jgi:hypothetical protein